MSDLFYNSSNKSFETTHSLQTVFNQRLTEAKEMLRLSYYDYETQTEKIREWSTADKLQQYIIEIRACEHLMNITFNEWMQEVYPHLTAVTEPDAKMAASMLQHMDTISCEFFNQPNATEEQDKRHEELAIIFYDSFFTIECHNDHGNYQIKLENSAAVWTAISDALAYVIEQQ